ncbi:hypothetical protein BGZ98_005080 [Dissophora globulifera]|nr:hypothetical protein BGZ98_005080 [Dissophora globulifera]
MSSHFPPQSRMPTLLPQRTETLWYPRQTGVEHMQRELDREEAAYEQRELDDHEEEEEEEEEDEEEDEDNDDDGMTGMEGEQDLDQDPDLDDNIRIHDHDLYEQDSDVEDYFPNGTSNNGRLSSTESIYTRQMAMLERDLDDGIEEATNGDSDDNDEEDAAILYSPSHEESQ